MLIATDIIARGLDIAGVSHVFNFDTPDEAENYIHRIGRTGRADREGIAITFTTPKETPFKKAIEALINTSIPMKELPSELEIVDKLTPDEMPKNIVKNIQDKFERKEPTGAFHEKSDKNKKVNAPISRGEKLKLKYGKPKTRGQKKKK